MQGPFLGENGGHTEGWALHLLFWKLKIKVRSAGLVWKP